MRTLLALSALLGLSACSLLSESAQEVRRAEFDGDGDGDVDGERGGDDCDDEDPLVGPSVAEVCDGLDNDCDGEVDEGLLTDAYQDHDGDGYGLGEAVPVCQDAEGYSDQGGDCNDANDAVNPGANESCNGVDDDCNGAIDDAGGSLWYADTDGDGYGDPAEPSESCGGGESLVADNTDCDDGDEGINPDADEICDNLDQDCDGTIDEDPVNGVDWYLDSDGDGIGGDTTESGCSPPTTGGFWTDIGGDCDDTDLEVAPGAQELCDERDNDCDGQVDETAPTWFVDADGDGFGEAGGLTQEGCDQPSGFVSNDNDCDDSLDTVRPTASEVCNDIDDDCDGLVDDDDPSATGQSLWYADADGDGHGEQGGAASSLCADPGAGWHVSSDDCDDADADVNPDQSESCNWSDDDCNGLADEGLPGTDYYADSDGDGHGEEGGTPAEFCADPGAGWHAFADDCDDTDASINPSATEDCNGVDDNCSGDETDHDDWDTWYADTDTDTYGDATSTVGDCAQPSGHVDNSDDCVDSDATINPDTVWYQDSDGDGYGDAATSVKMCVAASTGLLNPTQEHTDCDDAASTSYPGAPQACDDVTDADCDGSLDNDGDSDGFSDDSCGGSDCDDTDADTYPSSGCALIDCLDILDAGESTGDGLYEIDPDGAGPNVAFEVYCDMTRRGGGWTQVLHDDFEGSVVGSWLPATTTTCGSGNHILGGYTQQASGNIDIAIDAKGVPHDMSWFEYDIYRIDSWEDTDRWGAELEGDVVMRYYSWPFDAPNICGSNANWYYGDAIWAENWARNQAADPINLRFRGQFNSQPTNESWGIDNFTSWVRRHSPDPAPGHSSSNPADSCYAIQQAGNDVGTGQYWIDVGNGAFETRCEMDLAGGGWTLLFQRRQGNANRERFGTNLNDYLRQSGGDADNLSADQSFSIDMDNLPAHDAYLFLFYDTNGNLDYDDSHQIMSSNDIFPDQTAMANQQVAGVCDLWGENCDTSDVYFRYTGGGYYMNTVCDATGATDSRWLGTYGYCHNGLGNYYSNSLFGSMDMYYEVKLWGWNSPSTDLMSRVYAR